MTFRADSSVGNSLRFVRRKNWLFAGSLRSGRRAAGGGRRAAGGERNEPDPEREDQRPRPAGLPSRCTLASTQYEVIRDRQPPAAQLEYIHQGVMAGRVWTPPRLQAFCSITIGCNCLHVFGLPSHIVTKAIVNARVKPRSISLNFEVIEVVPFKEKLGLHESYLIGSRFIKFRSNNTAQCQPYLGAAASTGYGDLIPPPIALER
jgi:hypothetical protein